LTLEISVSKRIVDATGKETNVDADNDLIVLPPQVVIPARGSQKFRLQYSGAALASGSAYTMMIKQVPVDLPDMKKSGIRFLVNFGVGIYVNQADAAADIRVVSVSQDKAPDQLAILVQNAGNRTISLALGKWSVTDTRGTSFALTQQDLATAQQSFVMPGKFQRRFVVKKPKGFQAGGDMKAKFEPSNIVQ
jgi:fimbrial chaperone protein